MRRLIKVKPVSMKVHPDFYAMTEEIRKKYEKKGIKLSQIKLSKMIHQHLNTKRRGLGLLGNV